MTNLPIVNIKDLLDAGVHFGHRTSRWNPKMAPFIYGVRDNIHILDLQQSAVLMQVSLKKIYDTVKANGKVLFVSSKVQATDLVAEYAEKCGQFYINNRWLGGIMTNWKTVSQSIKHLDEIEKQMKDEDAASQYTKKELLVMSRKRDKLLKSFGGIRKIGGVPDLLIIIDTNKEHLAIKEAKKLGVPIVAIVDTNSNPEDVDFPIPGNDDAIRSIRCYCNLFAEAALAGIRDGLEEAGADLTATVEGAGQNNLDNVTKLAASKNAKILPNVATEKVFAKKQANTKPRAEKAAVSQEEVKK